MIKKLELIYVSERFWCFTASFLCIFSIVQIKPVQEQKGSFHLAASWKEGMMLLDGQENVCSH